MELQVIVFNEIKQTLKDDYRVFLLKVEARLLKKDGLQVVEGQLGKGKGWGMVREDIGEGGCNQRVSHMCGNVTVVPANVFLNSIEEGIHRKSRVLWEGMRDRLAVDSQLGASPVPFKALTTALLPSQMPKHPLALPQVALPIRSPSCCGPPAFLSRTEASSSLLISMPPVSSLLKLPLA